MRSAFHTYFYFLRFYAYARTLRAPWQKITNLMAVRLLILSLEDY